MFFILNKTKNLIYFCIILNIFMIIIFTKIFQIFKNYTNIRISFINYPNIKFNYLI